MRCWYSCRTKPAGRALADHPPAARIGPSRYGRRGVVAGLGLLAACGRAPDSSLGRATIDTLPTGIIQVANDAPTGWSDSSSGWRVRLERQIRGEPGTPSELIDPRSIALDSQDRVWVSDRSPARIKVYGTDGGFIRTVGGEGEGPGEFRSGYLAPVSRGVVLHDPQLSRTTVYDTAGHLVKTFLSQCCYEVPIGSDSADRVVMPGLNDGGGNMVWLRYDLAGSILDSIKFVSQTGQPHWRVGNPKEMEMFVGVPFTPTLEMRPHPSGGMLLGHSGTYQLSWIRSTGDTLFRFTRRWTPEPVTSEEKQRAIDEMIADFKPLDEATLRKAFRSEEIPSVKPAFEGLQVDLEGNTWVRRGGGRFDVFDRGGVWLGELMAPSEFDAPVAFFGRDRIVTAGEDSVGQPVVLVWRVERGKP